MKVEDKPVVAQHAGNGDAAGSGGVQTTAVAAAAAGDDDGDDDFDIDDI